MGQMPVEVFSPDNKPYIRFQARKPGAAHEPTMLVLQGPATAFGNPGGVRRIFDVVPEDVRLGYADLSEGFFLHYMLNGGMLRQVYEQERNTTAFQQGARLLGLTDQRIHQVIEGVDEARLALSQYDTYRRENFPQFVATKKLIEGAAKIVSAPFVTREMAERVSLHHNMVNYTSAFRNSREKLLAITQQAGIFTDYIRHHVLPGLLGENPDVMVISITHPAQMTFSFQFAAIAREAGYRGQIIVGGNTASRRADTWIQEDELNHRLFRGEEDEEGCILDAISVGNGEVPLGILAAELALGIPLDRDVFLRMPGLVYKRDGKIVGHKLAIPTALNAYKAREDVSGFFTPGFMPEGFGIQSVRKRDICPYDEETRGGCKFCAISKGSNQRLAAFLRAKGVPFIAPQGEGNYALLDPILTPSVYEPIQQQAMTTRELVDDIEQGYKAGFPIVTIADEQWLAQDGIELLEELQKRGLNKDSQKPNVVYSAYMRIDDIKDEETVAKLAASGLRFVQFGLESTYLPKMASMLKGTSEPKLARFKEQLAMLVRHGIMPHVFLITGSPLEKVYWANRKRFAVEETALGRRITPDDVEAFEAIYNLRYLWDVRDYIFTLKQTQSKVAYGSVDSLFLARKALKRDEKRWQQADLAANVPVVYEAGYGIDGRTVNTILELYELWKKEVLPFQEVAQELVYDQRLLPEYRLEGIAAEAAKNPPGEHRLTQQEINRKAGILRRLWVRFVGQDYAELVDKVRKQLTNRLYQEQFAAIKDRNLFTREFPSGFSDWSDLYRAADLLEAERKKAA